MMLRCFGYPHLAILFLLTGCLAFAQAPSGDLTINTGDLTATMTADAGWTVRTLNYQGTPLFVSAGGQGAVYMPKGGKWVGSAMETKEKPILLDVTVDGARIIGDLSGSVTGDSVTLTKASIMGGMGHTAVTTYEADLFIAKHYFLALEDLDLASFYAFIYSVTPDTDEWLAEVLGGQEVEGVFTASKGQLVNRDVAWVAQFDKDSGKGLVCYYTTPFRGPGSATRIWDTAGYHKHFSQPLAGEVKAGTELSYGMVMKFFTADADAWQDEARKQVSALRQRFPAEVTAVQEGPQVYDEGVPEDGYITAKTRDYKIVFSAKQAWTIYDFTFQDHMIGHSQGFYGTVLIPVGSNFIGTGHTEGGREIVHAVKLLVDGEEVPIEIDKTYEGSRIELVKDSTIHKFRARATITVTDDEVIERQELEAVEDHDLKLMYLFMHCWQGTTTTWTGETPEGETIGGQFESAKGNAVLKDTRWVAQYEPNMGIGIIGYTPKVAAGPGSHTMIWDLERYHKFYTQRVATTETFTEGQKLDYTMVVKGVASEDGTWDATDAAMAKLKETYPPVEE